MDSDVYLDTSIYLSIYPSISISIFYTYLNNTEFWRPKLRFQQQFDGLGRARDLDAEEGPLGRGGETALW